MWAMFTSRSTPKLSNPMYRMSIPTFFSVEDYRSALAAIPNTVHSTAGYPHSTKRHSAASARPLPVWPTPKRCRCSKPTTARIRPAASKATISNAIAAERLQYLGGLNMLNCYSPECYAAYSFVMCGIFINFALYNMCP